MLRKFSVENYKGFNEKIQMDLTKVRNYTFNTDCVSNGLITTGVILGKNGCGKTNLGLALFDIVPTLTDFTHDTRQDDEISFLNGFSKKPFATFCYEFDSPMGIIGYEYRKTKPNEIVYESFQLNGKVLFERNGLNGTEDYSGLVDFDAGNLNMNIGNGKLSILRYINNNTVQSEDSPFRFVKEFVEHMLYFRSTYEGNTYIGMTNDTDLILDYIMKNGLVEDFQRFLNDVVKVDMEVGSIHFVDGKDFIVQNTINKPLPFMKVASSGTSAATLFFYWMQYVSDIRFLYIDEFDAYYHYALSESILSILMKKKDVQTLVSTHNTPLFSSKLLRADCYLYMRKGKMSSFADSTDMEIRQGHNLEKLYRGGEFDD